MDLTLKEICCPNCKTHLEQGSITAGIDTQMVKKCFDCGFWMIIIIPHKDYDYKIVKTLKKEWKQESDKSV